MRTQGIALRRGGAGSLLLSGPTLVALVAAAILLPPVVAIAGFVCVSAAALREFGVPRWLYLAVPLQYGFVAAASWPLASLCVPLLATLAVPLVAVLAGDTRDLAARSAQQCWAVLFAVYALSHAPAIAMLPWPQLGRGDVAVCAIAVVLLGFVGARVAHAMGLPSLDRVAAVAFPAPVLFHFLRAVG